MAYQTGTASSPIDLIQQMVTWLVGIGWTTDLSAVEGLGWRAHLHKNGNYVHLRACMNEIPWQSSGYPGYGLLLYLSTAFDGSQAWNNQPGNPPIASGLSYPVGVAMPLFTGGAIQNYYFFSDAADNVAIIVERTAGLYVHFGWGPSLNKAGTWTGGVYFFGTSCGYGLGYGIGFQPFHPSPGLFDSSSCPGADADYFQGTSMFIRADVDSFTGKWIGIYSNLTPTFGYTGQFGRSSVQPMFNISLEFNIPGYASAGNITVATYDFQFNQTSQMDGRANLLPVLLWTRRDIGEFSLLGSIPNIFASNGVGNGFSNASEYTLGTTTYKIFPNFAVVKQ